MISKRQLELGLCGILLTACGGSGDATSSAAAPSPSSAVAPTPAPAAEAPKGPPPASIQENTFRLALEADPAYVEGKGGKFRVVLKAMGGYHVNQDYPIRVDLSGPESLKLDKRSFGKPDASQFGEEAARFEVPFSAQKGTHEVSATVDFAVCTKETCVPDQRTVALNLQVM